MATATLKKATRNGFTVLPNNIVDDILSAAEKHTADSLALLIYCVRHIPAQKGTLALQGAFSQGRVCADLGWGQTNKQRLKRAIHELENLGVIVTELRDNNTLLLHIKADVQQPISSNHEENSGGEGRSRPAHQNFKTQGAKISSAIYIKKKSLIKSQKNLHTHSVTSQHQETCNSLGEAKDDDEVLKLCSLYSKSTGKIVTTSQRESFSRIYLENSSPLSLVQKAIEVIASHPKLLKDTVSINAVWQLDYMRKAAHTFDANTRALISNLLDRRAENPEGEVLKAASESGVDLEVFKKYFASDLEKMREKSQTETPNHQTYAFTEETFVPILSEFSSRTLAPAKQNEDDICVRASNLDQELHTPPSVTFRPVFPEGRVGEAETFDDCRTIGPRRDNILGDAIKKNSVSLTSPQKDPFHDLLSLLMGSSTKTEFVSILSGYQSDQLPLLHQSKFDVLKECAFSHNASFQSLKGLVASHIKQHQKKKSAAFDLSGYPAAWVA